MRVPILLIGAGTPKEATARGGLFLLAAHHDGILAIVIFALDQAGLGILVVTVNAAEMITPATSSMGC